MPIGSTEIQSSWRTSTLLQLQPFPGTICKAVTALTAEAVRISPSLLQLTYQLMGNLTALRIPAPVSFLMTAPAATALLWQHTCFEIFFRESGTDAYNEYNFSPSLNWDHYRFSTYRQPLAEAIKLAPTLSILRHDASQLILQALVPLPSLMPLDISLTAVMEATTGDKTYYALAHKADKPDFHMPDSFTLRI